MEYIRKALAWVFLSSNDPSKWSLTVRATLEAAGVTIIQVATAACGFGFACIGLDNQGWSMFVDNAVNLVAGIAMIVITVRWFYGFFRKVFLTAIGKNQVLNP